MGFPWYGYVLILALFVGAFTFNSAFVKTERISVPRWIKHLVVVACILGGGIITFVLFF